LTRCQPGATPASPRWRSGQHLLAGDVRVRSLAVLRPPGMAYRLLYDVLLKRLDAEGAHRLASTALRLCAATPPVRALLRRLLVPCDDRLRVEALGRQLPSPLGLAAG